MPLSTLLLISPRSTFAQPARRQQRTKTKRQSSQAEILSISCVCCTKITFEKVKYVKGEEKKDKVGHFKGKGTGVFN
jgi:hypothetical protein